MSYWVTFGQPGAGWSCGKKNIDYTYWVPLFTMELTNVKILWYLVCWYALKEIDVGDSDPNEFDHGAIDDLIKGRKRAAWRFL